MAVEIEIFPRQMPPGGTPTPATAIPKAGKALSTSFAEMMAAADASGAPTAAPAGPRPLSANFAEMMAAVDAADTAALGDHPLRVRDLDPRQRMMYAPARHGSGGGIDFHPFGEDGLTFGDLIDVINPLQHIPIIGTIYRWLTGDEISPVASLAGGFLFGGPIGLAASAVNVVVDAATGDDIGGNVMTAMFGESPAADGGGFDPDIDFGTAPERTWGVAATKAATTAPQLAAAPAPLSASGDAPSGAATAAPPHAGATQQDIRSGEAVVLSEDQLATLLSMGNGQRTLKPLPPPGPPAKMPLTTAAPASGTNADASGISASMISAMDRYEAMLKARAAAAAQQAPGAAGPVRVSA